MEALPHGHQPWLGSEALGEGGGPTADMPRKPLSLWDLSSRKWAKSHDTGDPTEDAVAGQVIWTLGAIELRARLEDQANRYHGKGFIWGCP